MKEAGLTEIEQSGLIATHVPNFFKQVRQHLATGGTIMFRHDGTNGRLTHCARGVVGGEREQFLSLDFTTATEEDMATLAKMFDRSGAATHQGIS